MTREKKHYDRLQAEIDNLWAPILEKLWAPGSPLALRAKGDRSILPGDVIVHLHAARRGRVGIIKILRPANPITREEIFFEAFFTLNRIRGGNFQVLLPDNCGVSPGDLTLDVQTKILTEQDRVAILRPTPAK